MDLKDCILQIEHKIESAISVEDKGEAKRLKKEAKEIMKDLKKIKQITVEDVLFIDDFFDRINEKKEKWNVDEKHLLHGAINACFGMSNQLWKLKRDNVEAWMDAEAYRVRQELDISSPQDKETLQFKVKLVGIPSHQKRMFLLEMSRTPIEIKIPKLEFKGIAKLDSDLLYFDRAHWMLRDSSIGIGPIGEFRFPQAIPLSMITALNIPSEDSAYDFDLLLSSSDLEVNHEQIRNFRKSNRNFDYHPIDEILIRFKIESNKESKPQIFETLRQAFNNRKGDVNWTVSYLRQLGYGFKPVMRGTLLPVGVYSPPPFELDTTPLTESRYRELLLQKYDDDNVQVHDGIIEDISVIWGGNLVSSEFTALLSRGVIPLVPTKVPVSMICVGSLGAIDHVSLKTIQGFSNASINFVKENWPTNEAVISIPILMTNSIDADAKSWVQDKFEKSLTKKYALVPIVVHLEEKKVYYREDAPFVGKEFYNVARLFIERYVITNEMRWKDLPISITKESRINEKAEIVISQEPLRLKCPHCRAIYKFDEIPSEVECQNCLKVYRIPENDQ